MRKQDIWNEVVLAALVILMLLPILYMILIALTPSECLFITFIPRRFTLRNLSDVFSDPITLRYYLNTWVIAISTVALSLALASLAGYGLSRFRFKIKNWFILGALVTQMLPMEVLVISYFRIIQRLGLYNTRVALILVDTTITVPFCTLMLKSIFDGIPREIEEAAMIDGCSKMTAFFRITLPISWAGLFAAGTFAFLQSWGEYLYALTLTTDYRATPMTVQVTKMIGQYVTSWEAMAAMALLCIVPVLLLFGLTQHVFLQGLTAGAVKE
ncbi:MAG TPA: carbohydrate ABC transporter permease [Firmicutes bacterium]|nr:carbohydrate ABC transporter permease [Bacillota bacterium]